MNCKAYHATYVGILIAINLIHVSGFVVCALLQNAITLDCIWILKLLKYKISLLLDEINDDANNWKFWFWIYFALENQVNFVSSKISTLKTYCWNAIHILKKMVENLYTFF